MFKTTYIEPQVRFKTYHTRMAINCNHGTICREPHRAVFNCNHSKIGLESHLSNSLQ